MNFQPTFPTPDWTAQYPNLDELNKDFGLGLEHRLKLGWNETEMDTVLAFYLPPIRHKSTNVKLKSERRLTVLVWNRHGVRLDLALLLSLPVNDMTPPPKVTPKK